MTMNTELPYYYETDVVWKEGRMAELSAPGLPEITVAPPPEFKGVGGVWTPEHLYIASINACFIATVIGISANLNLEYESLASNATAKLEKVEGKGLIITEAVLR